MSLLLDALKKAAQDKQQVTSAADSDPVKTPESDADVELTLDEPVVEKQQEAGTPQAETAEDPSIEPELELEKTVATTSTVSDEALHMLVYKTNKQFRYRQKLLWGGTLAAALTLLIVGGVYYYFIMLEEVESLERKHDIAMRLFESQAVIASNKNQYADEPVVVPVKPEKVVKKTVAASTASQQIKRAQQPLQDKQVFSVTHSKKENPVGVLLNAGWAAYGKEDYPVASDAYAQVLEREPNNRDALLGKAAIAVKQGDYQQAKETYSVLLRLDPRDQIAVSAISNLDEVAPDELGESKLKFMIQQQPNAPHLHFALGNFYAKQSRWPEAQGEYFSSWQGSNENADYAFNLAVSLDQLGKVDDARRFYELSLNLSAGKNVSFSVQTVKDRLNKIAEK